MRVFPLIMLLLLIPSSLVPFGLKNQGSSSVENDEIRVIFTVYEYYSHTIRFNLTIINLRDEFYLVNHTWGYFNAEIFSTDDEYLGKVRDENEEKMLFFLAPNGTHVRHWIWDQNVKNEMGFTKLKKGNYKIRGVFKRPEYTLKTDVFEVYLGYTRDRTLSPVGKYVTQYDAALQYASIGVLASGFIQQIYISLFYSEPANWPSKRRMVTILWMLTIIFSILLLTFSSEAGYYLIKIVKEI